VVAKKIWERRADRKDSEFALLCGLLHDLGKAVYFKKAPLHYSFVFAQERSGSDPSLSAVEQEYYGISHAPLGALLAESWGLPSALCNVIRNHHSGVDPNAPIVATVSLADTVARLCGVGYDGERRANPDEIGQQSLLGVDAEEFVQLKSFAESQRKEIERFFQFVS
jgi:putative nucleotidyltransferase with HDIG domain